MSEQAEMIPAGIAMVKVLEAWGVDHLYGIPGGSFNSTMDALLAEKDNIQYIQVRHEEVGAMAAAADAKLTGKIGVAFGSAGPGGTHLLNGLYDAREDHVPVLALIGQFGTSGMNMDTFQEMNDNDFLNVMLPFADWNTTDGNTIKRLYNNDIETTEIPLPSKIEQEEIVRKINDLQEIREGMQEKLDEISDDMDITLNELLN